MRQPPQSPAESPSTQRVREVALDWFVRRRNKDFSAKEECAFQSWLQSDPKHGDAFAHWQDEWQAFEVVPADMRAMLQRNLAYDSAMQAASAAGTLQSTSGAESGLEQRLTQAEVKVKAGSPGSLLRRRVLAPTFAVAAIAITAGTGLLAWNHWQAQPVFAQTFSSQRGQQVDLSLPDGSRLRLDTATRVNVTYYRDRREVSLLGGQAVFAVQADGTRPFQVRAGPLRVTVVGTRFSVRHTPDIAGDDGVHVAVEEGRVRVERAGVQAGSLPRDGDQVALYLTPGQQVASNAAGALSAVTAVPDEGIAPWRDNRVKFDDVPLDRALAELARYRDIQLVVRDPAVAALRISGVFDPRDMSTFKRVLPLSLPVRLRDADGVTEVVPLR